MGNNTNSKEANLPVDKLGDPKARSSQTQRDASACSVILLDPETKNYKVELYIGRSIWQGEYPPGCKVQDMLVQLCQTEQWKNKKPEDIDVIDDKQCIVSKQAYLSEIVTDQAKLMLHASMELNVLVENKSLLIECSDKNWTVNRFLQEFKIPRLKNGKILVWVGGSIGKYELKEMEEKELDEPLRTLPRWLYTQTVCLTVF